MLSGSSLGLGSTYSTVPASAAASVMLGSSFNPDLQGGPASGWCVGGTRSVSPPRNVPSSDRPKVTQDGIIYTHTRASLKNRVHTALAKLARRDLPSDDEARRTLEAFAGRLGPFHNAYDAETTASKFLQQRKELAELVESTRHGEVVGARARYEEYGKPLRKSYLTAGEDPGPPFYGLP